MSSIKKYLVIVLVPVLLVGVLVMVRFLGGREDTWICQDGRWVAHGNPDSPSPATGCGLAETNLPVTSQKQVSLYFNNIKKAGENVDCGAVYPAIRELPSDSYEDVLRQLFSGPNTQEQAEGFSSSFNNRTSDMLISVNVIDSKAYVNMKDLRGSIGNSSCQIAEFLSQTGETLKQDGKVSKVIYAIEGNPETFYEYMQLGCSSENDFCDPEPFR